MAAIYSLLESWHNLHVLTRIQTEDWIQTQGEFRCKEPEFGHKAEFRQKVFIFSHKAQFRQKESEFQTQGTIRQNSDGRITNSDTRNQKADLRPK